MQETGKQSTTGKQNNQSTTLKFKLDYKSKVTHTKKNDPEGVSVTIPDAFRPHLSNDDFYELIRHSICAHMKGHEANSHQDLRHKLFAEYPKGYNKLKESWEKAAAALVGPGRNKEVKKKTVLEGRSYERVFSSK